MYSQSNKEEQEEKLSEIFNKNKKLVTIMQNVCEEFEFEVAMFYGLVTNEAGDECLSARD